MTRLQDAIPGVCIAALLAAGCSAGGDAAGGVMVRDTVFVRAASTDTVRIVENPAAAAMPARWSVSAEPALDLGGPDAPEDEALFRVASAYRLSDGRIVVGDGGSTSLKVFDDAGRLTATIGRAGDGPGEFRGINHFALLSGDSLAVWDFAHGRLTVFDASGVIGREVRIGASPASPMSNVGGVFADASLMSRGFIRLTDGIPKGLTRVDAPLLHLSPEGLLLDTLDAVRSGEQWFVERENGFTVFSPPFMRTTDIVAAGQLIMVGDTEHPEIRVLSPDGTPRLLVRWAHEPRRITPSDIDSARTHILGDNPADGRRTDVDRMFAEMRMPAVMPAFSTLRLDVDGNLWVMDYRTDWDEGDVSWTVFDADGRMIARLMMPGRFRPTHIGRDFILGVATDELDVEHVLLYPLQRD